MSARKKLNQGYINGCLLTAGVVGAACESWTVFWIAAAILMGLSFHSGDIRLTNRSADRRDRPPRR